MIIEKEATFYNDVAEVMAPNHALRPLWLRLARDLPWGEPILDLGCGTGGFPSTLALLDYPGTYHGVDFSFRSLELAQDALRGSRLNAKFTIVDLRDSAAVIQDARSVRVMTEVLEHITDDLEVIDRWVPVGTQLFLSVPNYPSEAHVRWFDTAKTVVERYAPLLDFVSWWKLDLSPPEGRAAFLFEATRC